MFVVAVVLFAVGVAVLVAVVLGLGKVIVTDPSVVADRPTGVQVAQVAPPWQAGLAQGSLGSKQS